MFQLKHYSQFVRRVNIYLNWLGLIFIAIVYTAQLYFCKHTTWLRNVYTYMLRASHFFIIFSLLVHWWIKYCTFQTFSSMFPYFKLRLSVIKLPIICVLSWYYAGDTLFSMGSNQVFFAFHNCVQKSCFFPTLYSTIWFITVLILEPLFKPFEVVFAGFCLCKSRLIFQPIRSIL